MLETLIWLGQRIVLGTISVLSLAWLYKELTMGICRSKKRLDGKVAIVTGGSIGIGYETVLDLARRGAEVIIASRNVKKCEVAREGIKKLTGNNRLHAMKLDLSSQRDIKRFASEIEGKFARVHFLVNNAGMLTASDDGKKRTNSEDGFEASMATNYFGTFALTELLLEKVLSSGMPGDPSRIVHVSSMAHLDAKVNPEFDLDSFANDMMKQYSVTKLLMNLNCKALSLQLKGTHSEIACLHPGMILTDISNQFDERMRMLVTIVATIFGKTKEMGAQTTIHCVVADESINGKYYSDCREERLLVNKSFYNEKLAQQIYEKTKQFLTL